MPYIHEGPWLYLTADGEVVEEGDVRAATVLVAPGGTLSDEDVKRYKLESRKAKPAPKADAGETDAAEGEKARPAPPNKARQGGSETKGR